MTCALWSAGRVRAESRDPHEALPTWACCDHAYGASVDDAFVLDAAARQETCRDFQGDCSQHSKRRNVNARLCDLSVGVQPGRCGDDADPPEMHYIFGNCWLDSFRAHGPSVNRLYARTDQLSGIIPSACLHVQEVLGQIGRKDDDLDTCFVSCKLTGLSVRPTISASFRRNHSWRFRSSQQKNSFQLRDCMQN